MGLFDGVDPTHQLVDETLVQDGAFNQLEPGPALDIGEIFGKAVVGSSSTVDA